MKEYTPQDKPVKVDQGTAIAVLDEKGVPCFYVIINRFQTEEEARNIANLLSNILTVMNLSEDPQVLINFTTMLFGVLGLPWPKKQGKTVIKQGKKFG